MLAHLKTIEKDVKNITCNFCLRKWITIPSMVARTSRSPLHWFEPVDLFSLATGLFSSTSYFLAKGLSFITITSQLLSPHLHINILSQTAPLKFNSIAPISYFLSVLISLIIFLFFRVNVELG